jgi:hypothetical protein
LPTGGTESTICDGTLMFSQNSTTGMDTEAVDRTTYCSKALASKKYTQK